MVILETLRLYCPEIARFDQRSITRYKTREFDDSKRFICNNSCRLDP
jgi:hypothetical protein